MSEDRVPFGFGPASLAHPDGPNRYLTQLSDFLCYGLRQCGTDERANWWAKFRRFTHEMGISGVECRGIYFEDEVKAVLSPDNPAALEWSRCCIESGLAHQPDHTNPGSVIVMLYWPAITASWVDSSYHRLES